jgi:hypothetical protein
MHYQAEHCSYLPVRLGDWEANKNVSDILWLYILTSFIPVIEIEYSPSVKLRPVKLA